MISPPRSHRLLCIVLASPLLLLLVAPPVRPNAVTIEFDPSLAGQLVPRHETHIEVEREDLTIHFEEYPTSFTQVASIVGGPVDSPVRVFVTARYHLRNPTFSSHRLQLAFPIVRTGPEQHVEWIRGWIGDIDNRSLKNEARRGVRSRISVDGRPLEHQYISFESLFEKERPRWVSGVRSWLQKYPALLPMLEGPLTTETKDTSNTFRRPVRTGRRETRELLEKTVKQLFPYGQYLDRTRDVTTAGNYRTCSLLMLMYSTQAVYYSSIDEWDLDFLSFAYSFLHPAQPDAVATFLEGWGVENEYLDLSGEFLPNDLLATLTAHTDLAVMGRRIDFLYYEVDFRPRQNRVIEVNFSHLINAAIAQNGMTRWENKRETRPLMNPALFNLFPDRPATFAANNYHFQYILRTSPQWGSFGPIHLTLSARWLDRDSDPTTGSRSFLIPAGAELNRNIHVGGNALLLAGPPDMHPIESHEEIQKNAP